jgi:hypothetical protein
MRWAFVPSLQDQVEVISRGRRFTDPIHDHCPCLREAEALMEALVQQRRTRLQKPHHDATPPGLRADGVSWI